MKHILLILSFVLLFTGCGKKDDTAMVNAGIDKKSVVGREYNWSTMDQGPYSDKIGYATSTDLVHWSDSGKTLAEHASVPGAAVKDGTIYLYFVDVATDGISEQLGLMKSTDQGETWSEKEIIKISGAENKVPVDPTPLVLPDGRFRLYYLDILSVDSTNKIYSAISDNGVNYTEEAGVRLEYAGVFDPDVIFNEGAYFMYVGSMEGNNVYVATSIDGLNFNEPQLAYAGGAIPDAFFDGTKYYLYMGGIIIATSDNGLNYEKSDYSFQSNLGQITADPAIVKIGENNYLLFYKYKNMPAPIEGALN